MDLPGGSISLHGISRALDPQLHIHAVTFNFTGTRRGKYRTLDASKLYEHKHTAGASSRRTRGETESPWLRDDAMAFVLPRRTAQSQRGVLETRRADSGGVGRAGGHAEAEDTAALSSREPKRDVDRDELLAEWREVAQQHGFTAERVSELRAHVKADDRDRPQSFGRQSPRP